MAEASKEGQMIGEITEKVAELCNWCVFNKRSFMHKPGEPYTHPELIDTARQLYGLFQDQEGKLFKKIESFAVIRPFHEGQPDTMYFQLSTDEWQAIKDSIPSEHAKKD